jgi:F0F1-type ATP synthase membrane subunit b/b'
MRRLIAGVSVVVALAFVRIPVLSAFECPSRIDEAKSALQKAEAAFEKANAAARAAARGPLTKAKNMLAHAEAEHRGAGGDVKKHAEAVREARTAQGYAEEARVIAERF